MQEFYVNQYSYLGETQPEVGKNKNSIFSAVL